MGLSCNLRLFLNKGDFLINLFHSLKKKVTSRVVAYFCHHLSDNYVDLSDNYHVDLSDNYVDLSDPFVDWFDHYVDLSKKNHHI